LKALFPGPMQQGGLNPLQTAIQTLDAEIVWSVFPDLPQLTAHLRRPFHRADRFRQGPASSSSRSNNGNRLPENGRCPIQAQTQTVSRLAGLPQAQPPPRLFR